MNLFPPWWEAGLLQLPLVCFHPYICCWQNIWKSKSCVCVQCSPPTVGTLIASGSGGQRVHLAGLAHLDGLKSRQGAPRILGSALAHVATAWETWQSPFSPCTSEEPDSETDRQLQASLCRSPGRGDQMDITFPRLLVRPPHIEDWFRADKFPSSLLGEFFPFRSGKLVC